MNKKKLKKRLKFISEDIEDIIGCLKDNEVDMGILYKDIPLSTYISNIEEAVDLKSKNVDKEWKLKTN